MLRKRGYHFITLDDALSDPAYGMPDTYTGEEGTGWLEHWAITRGRPPLGAPVFPPAILERSKALPPAPGESPAGGPANPCEFYLLGSSMPVGAPAATGAPP